MPFTAMGGQFHSISQEGQMLFQQGRFTTIMGGLIIDLVSAPIAPGNYTLDISTVIGGANIFLPRYVEFVVSGNTIIGGKDIHEGPESWQQLIHEAGDHIKLPPTPPEFALATPNPEQPVRIQIILNTAIGGVNIYRM